MSTLVLLTESYPLGGLTEPSFIGPEIDALAAEFDRVIIAPVLNRGPLLPLPPNVTADRSFLSRRPSSTDKGISLLWPDTWRHIWADSSFIHSPRQALAALAFSAYARHYRRQIHKLITHHSLDLANTLFYSFWFDYHTAALAGINGAKFITRAHGYDIYDSENPFLSHSWRQAALARMEACFPVSDHGTDYIRTDYPEYAEKVHTRHLGTAHPAGINPPPSPAAGDSAFTLMSIARVAPEKRVDLLCRCLCHWAGTHPSRQVRWIHVGDGPLMDALRREVAKAPANLTTELTGALPNAEVHRLLATRHVDITAMLSRSEGLGLAACESLSYGVPVIATAVGGLPETIDVRTGVLLSPDPTPEEFARRLDEAMPSLTQMRPDARIRWAENFDASRLRREFANEIRNMLP
ncbi:MAG: glycosyltransferase [Muribaculaceae bacterium]|nr:glycosyltransferase [Muribaculaceae bacterium]